VIARNAQSDATELETRVAESVAGGVFQCLRYGVTTVGDISRQCQLTRPLLSRGPIRVISFGEVMAMGERRDLLESRIAAASDRSQESEYLRIGISPHAPYSIEARGYQRCLEVARQLDRPICTHLAESLDEASFLARHEGPLRELWRAIGGWDDDVPRFAGGPIRFARSIGLLDYPTLLAHVNYCDDEELRILAQGRASVVYCPRTHAYFGHPPHRWREMLARGINVAIGTDSCASSPNLNLADDLRLLRKLAPELEAQELWALATTRATRALSMEAHVGSISIGKRADFVCFHASSDAPLQEILCAPMLPSAVWIAGMQVHPRVP
jgi:cytosine/adenosine deaminase-related metal-dependent hydrolase